MYARSFGATRVSVPVIGQGTWHIDSSDRTDAVRALRAGIDAGGASIDDFRHPDGVKGAFQHEFLVHDRAGEPCLVCGDPIVKFVAAGRGTYACERCQKRPRRRRAAADRQTLRR